MSRPTFAAAVDAFRASRRGVRFPRPADRLRHVVDGMGRAARDLTEGLMPHQAEAVRAIAAHVRASAVPSAICIAPTATGKTEIFVRLISGTATPADDGTSPTPTTLVLVPTRQLARQVSARLRTLRPDLHVGSISDGPAPVTVGTYDGFMARIRSGEIGPGDVDLLVLDEAHRSLSEERARAIGMFVGTAVVCAFTASPAYSVSKSVHELLGAGNVVVDIPLRRMVDEGVLPPIVNFVVRVRLVGDLPGDKATRDAVISRATAEAAFAFRRTHRDEVLGMALDGKSFVAYADNVSSARWAAGVFASADPSGRYETVHGKDARSRQDEVVAGLRSGAVDGAFNAILLSEGTDLPGVSLVLNLDPTASLVRQLQRCGRGLRPVREPGGRLRPAAIVDFVVEHGGLVLGRPQFYFEAFGDETIARVVEARPKSVSGLLRRIGGKDAGGEGGDEGWSAEALALGAHAPEVAKVAYLLRNRDVPDPSIPTLAPPWIGRESLGEHGLTHPHVRRIWERMAADALAGRIPKVGEREARFRRATHRGRPVWSIHVDDVPLLHRELRGIPPGSKSREWLSAQQVSARLGVPMHDGAFVDAWDALERGGGLGDGEPVRFEARRAAAGLVPCLHRSEVPRLRLRLGGRRDPGPGWMSEHEAMVSIGLEPPYAPFRRAWSRLAAGPGGVHLRRDDGATYLHEDGLGAFLDGQGISHLAQGRTPRGWLTPAEVARRLGADATEASALRHRCLQALAGSPDTDACEVAQDGLTVANRPWSRMEPLRVSPSSLPALAKFLGRPWPIPAGEPEAWLDLRGAVASVPEGMPRRRIRAVWESLPVLGREACASRLALAWIRCDGRTALRINAGQVPELARAPSTDEFSAARWITLAQAAQRAPRVPGMLARLVEAWETVAARAGTLPLRCPDLGVIVATVRVDGVDAPCVSKDDAQALLGILAGRAPPPDGRDSAWLAPVDAARRLGIRLTPRLVEVWHGVTVTALAGASPGITPRSPLRVGLRSIRGELRPCIHAVSLPALGEAVRHPFDPPRAAADLVPLAELADGLPMDQAGFRARRDLVALGRRHAAEGFATFDGIPLPILRRVSAEGITEAFLASPDADRLRRILSPGARRVGRT